MSKRLFLSDGTVIGLKRTFPLLDMPSQAMWHIISFNSTESQAIRYRAWCRQQVPAASPHSLMIADHVQRLDRFLAEHPDAEFYVG